MCWLIASPIWIFGGIVSIFNGHYTAILPCFWLGILSFIIYLNGGLQFNKAIQPQKSWRLIATLARIFKENTMRSSIEFIIGIAYIALMVGMAWSTVGELSGPSEPFSWWLPLIVLAVCGFPFVLGYLAGKNSR